MSDEKVYYPETISDNPLPGTEPESAVTQSSANEVYSPLTIKDTPIPHPVIARETISSSFNTKSRKILQQFEFTEHGAIQIGKYEHGVSGDIRITPSGIIARNKDGETTVGIDGDSGDGVFKGTLQAGTLIGADNQVVIEQGSSGGRIVIYNDGLPAIVIGDPT